jgi:hypothetical protein
MIKPIPEFQFFLSEDYDAAKPKTLKLLKFQIKHKFLWTTIEDASIEQG